MVVGTRVGSQEDDLIMEEERPAGRWGGRLLLFRLTRHADSATRSLTQRRGHGEAADPSCAHLDMQYMDEREFQSGVHALCWLRCPWRPSELSFPNFVAARSSPAEAS